jgi:hypothetical protein
LAMAPALPEGKPGTAPGPEPAAVPGGVRTVVTERTMWNDLRNGLRAVPGSGRPGRETRSTSKVAER